MTTIIKRNKWQVWGDVIFALFVREIRTGFNDKFGIAWSVVNPVAFIFMLSYMRGRMDGGATHTIPTFVFMALGIMLIQFFLEVLQNTSTAIKKNKALFAFRQVQPISAMIASALFSLLVKIAVFMVITLIMYFLGMEIHVDNLGTLLINILMLWIIAVSIGCIFGIASCFVPEISKVQSMLTRPLFFISATFFSLQDIPREYWVYLNWNPVLHAIELSRFSTYHSYGSAGVSESYLIIFTISSLFLSLACYQAFWKKAISR